MRMMVSLASIQLAVPAFFTVSNSHLSKKVSKGVAFIIPILVEWASYHCWVRSG